MVFTPMSANQPHSLSKRRGDPLVLTLTIGFALVFLLVSFWDMDGVADLIGSGYAWTAKALGSYFQLLLLATFFTALVVAFSPAGRARIGGVDRPEMSTFKWLSIIMCTLLAGGGVFFATGEPAAHFLTVPPPRLTINRVVPRRCQRHWRNPLCTGVFSPGRC